MSSYCRLLTIAGKIKLLNCSHNVVVILTFQVDQQQKMKQATFLAVGRSILYREGVLRRTGHSMLRDWNIDKVHESMSDMRMVGA